MVIVNGISIPIPFFLLPAFPFIVTFADFVTSTLRNKNTGFALSIMWISSSRENNRFGKKNQNAQPKRWIDRDLHRLKKTVGGRKSLAQNRKVAFIVDNSTAHPDVPGLTGIHLIFVLPNTTPVTLSMNQGVIRLLKAKCCTKVIRK